MAKVIVVASSYGYMSDEMEKMFRGKIDVVNIWRLEKESAAKINVMNEKNEKMLYAKHAKILSEMVSKEFAKYNKEGRVILLLCLGFDKKLPDGVVAKYYCVMPKKDAHMFSTEGKKMDLILKKLWDENGGEFIPEWQMKFLLLYRYGLRQTASGRLFGSDNIRKVKFYRLKYTVAGPDRIIRDIGKMVY